LPHSAECQLCRGSPEGAGQVHEAAGDGDQPGSDGAGHGELIDRLLGPEGGGPADQVVGEHRALQPGAVGAEVAGGDVFHPGSFFQVADGPLNDGVLAVEGVDGDDVVAQVGEEPEVAPVGPQLGLVAVGEPGAAHHDGPTRSPERIVFYGEKAARPGQAPHRASARLDVQDPARILVTGPVPGWGCAKVVCVPELPVVSKGATVRGLGKHTAITCALLVAALAAGCGRSPQPTAKSTSTTSPSESTSPQTTRSGPDSTDAPPTSLQPSDAAVVQLLVAGFRSGGRLVDERLACEKGSGCVYDVTLRLGEEAGRLLVGLPEAVARTEKPCLQQTGAAWIAVLRSYDESADLLRRSDFRGSVAATRRAGAGLSEVRRLFEDCF